MCVHVFFVYVFLAANTLSCRLEGAQLNIESDSKDTMEVELANQDDGFQIIYIYTVLKLLVHVGLQVKPENQNQDSQSILLNNTTL